MKHVLLFCSGTLTNFERNKICTQLQRKCDQFFIYRASLLTTHKSLSQVSNCHNNERLILFCLYLWHPLGCLFFFIKYTFFLHRNICFNHFFNNGRYPASFSFFWVFSNKQTVQILRQIYVKKCPSSIRCRDLNPFMENKNIKFCQL